jgi:hypothetical protein
MDLLFEAKVPGEVGILNRSYPLSAQIEPLTLSDKESIYQLIERYSYE